MKKFKLEPHQIISVAEGLGSCIASDRITVDGESIGYCYREEPTDAFDSGWTFLAGDESQEYLDDPENLSMFDVNTLANYDHALLPILDTPAPCQFERNELGLLVPVPGDSAPLP
jgi:hypothetical protein